MHQELAWLEILAPDLIDVVKQRYQVLQSIYWLAPIGRRLLAQELNMSERALRTETDFLRLHGLITTSKSGMILTTQGEEAYQSLTTVMERLLGVHSKEKQLSKVLGIDHCLIVAGDSTKLPKVLTDMGKLVNETLDVILPKGENVIAAMGGTTMANVANSLTPKLSQQRHLTFVPARGGLGEAVDIQANAVCARMAVHTGGELHFVVVRDVYNDHVFVADPALGNISFTRARFEEIWDQNVLFVIYPSGQEPRNALELREADLRLVDDRTVSLLAFREFAEMSKITQNQIGEAATNGDVQYIRRK